MSGEEAETHTSSNVLGFQQEGPEGRNQTKNEFTRCPVTEVGLRVARDETKNE